MFWVVGRVGLVVHVLACSGRNRRRRYPALEMGSRLEPFVDRYLIHRLDGATLALHAPMKVPRPKSPLVGAYVTVIQDGEIYRAVYRGNDPLYQGGGYDGNPSEFTGYAESVDGHEWTFPSLAFMCRESGEQRHPARSPVVYNFSPFLISDRARRPSDSRRSRVSQAVRWNGFKNHARRGERNSGRTLYVCVAGLPSLAADVVGTGDPADRIWL